jgi:hypothetical protein
MLRRRPVAAWQVEVWQVELVCAGFTTFSDLSVPSGAQGSGQECRCIPVARVANASCLNLAIRSSPLNPVRVRAT